jgi:signal transduction histidine kinase
LAASGLKLRSRGDKVAATARKSTDLDALKKRFGDAALLLSLDVTGAEQVRQVDSIAESNEESQCERLDLIRRNALRLQKLANTLLDFSRIETGRIQSSYEATDLAELTAELASVFRSAVEKAGLQLVVDCLPLADDFVGAAAYRTVLEPAPCAPTVPCEAAP